MAAFSVIALSTFVVVALTPPALYIITILGNIAFSVAVGFMVRRVVNANYALNLPAANKSVFITGCDTGLGYVAAVALHRKGFIVFAGCLDQYSEGALYLKSSGIIVLHVDYLRPDTIENAYRKICDVLNGVDLWAIVANAGVSSYGEVEWMKPNELQRLIDVNLVGTLKFVGTGIPQIRRSTGRIAIVTGLQGKSEANTIQGYTIRVASRLSIPGMAVASATTAALCQYADGLRRELRKFGVQVSAIEPAFYRQVLGTVVTTPPP
ncbi:D-beta-hydroxybutyrate dehydrogenase, mitochondrial-like [Ixodes scapularis]|uniref:D-beta-hydroxybutyrate dehydrogenase, mitochondrial-like n=1 Tax=Ixodes scapularis TaxID=6945 RepID=UPI001A9E49D8|nr:D-beta-hydroxybutyrate dehydrogenase, mitochondrial-like [Ixodes scapularis]